ncbi:serine/threonine-protein kinase [Actinocorallia sp. B10E7]|uniref:serine/threonine-protein kinase n=1 Tax=Actinocorallia sp. B10E7 TaxID=3153558 RepID=UPI00325F59AE
MRAGLEIAGRYRVGEKLGRGGFGEVWTAEDLLRDRRVAIKFLYRHVADSEPLWLSKFRQEARIAVRLNHPGVTSVKDFGEYDGQWYLVMEFLAGKDLGCELVEYSQGLEPGRAAGLVGQVVRALRVAHEHGIVHRDLKPGNLMLLAGDEVKICDFGIAHIAEASASYSLDGRQIGTPAYMAPEQWLGQPVDHRTDLYAVGIILHALLTGTPPFPGPTVTAFMGQHLTLPPPRITRPDIPRHLGELIHGLLQKDPDQRPDHAFVLASLVSPPKDGTQQSDRPTGPSGPESWDSSSTDRTPFTEDALLPEMFTNDMGIAFARVASGARPCDQAGTGDVVAELTSHGCTHVMTGVYLEQPGPLATPENPVLVSVQVLPFPDAATARDMYDYLNGDARWRLTIWCAQTGGVDVPQAGGTEWHQSFRWQHNQVFHRYVITSLAARMDHTNDGSLEPWFSSAANKAANSCGPQNYRGI